MSSLVQPYLRACRPVPFAAVPPLISIGMPPQDAHLVWLDAAVSGSCGKTRDGDGGDCEHGDKGSWTIGRGQAWQREGWVASAQECISRCSACARCKFISVTLWGNDCSWYAACDVGALDQSVPGVRSGPMPSLERASSLDYALGTPTTRIVGAAVALQISGHLRAGCQLDRVSLHVQACHRRFARCDVFLHTFSELEPRTPHWSGRSHRGAGPSHACAAHAVKLLGVARHVVEVQPPPPGEDDLAPDGRPFTERGTLGWGARRHHGWMMNVRGMHGAAQLRRQAEALGAEYAIAVRLRPDGLEFGGLSRAPVASEELQQLWDCMGYAAQRLPAPPQPSGLVPWSTQSSRTPALHGQMLSRADPPPQWQHTVGHQGLPGHRQRQLLLWKAARCRRGALARPPRPARGLHPAQPSPAAALAS